MAKLRAAILAAGRGTRMKDKRPKTLIPIADEQPMLHYILSGLGAAGVEDLLVVTGYAAAEIEAFTTERWQGAAKFVFNARWASWGNFHTARLAVEQSPGMDLMIVNSDVVVVPQVYKNVADARGELVLAVQRRPRFDAEDMRVELDGDRVRQIGKQVKMPRSHAEFAGVSLLRPPAARAYADVATDWEWRAQTAGYYEDVYAALLDSVDCRAVTVRQDEYAEVDVPEDMTAATHVIDKHRDAWTSEDSAVTEKV